MGNPNRLTRAGGPGRSWARTAMFLVATTSSLLLTVGLGLALWVAVPTALLDWRPTLVSSGSMAPLLSPGDVVMLRPADTGGVVVGTVVLYDMPGTGPVLHRVVAVLEDGSLLTRGDANDVSDSAPVRLEQVRGTAVLLVPWVGLPSLALERGDASEVAVYAVLLVGAVGLAPRAADPSFDPWQDLARVLPGDLLLARRDLGNAGSGRRLLAHHDTDDLLTRLAAPGRAVTTQEART